MLTRSIFPQLVIDLDKLRKNLAALTVRCQDLLIEISPVVKAANALPEVARVMGEKARYLQSDFSVLRATLVQIQL